MNVSALFHATSPFGLSAVSGFGHSPFGGLLPFGSFGPPFIVGIAPPPPLLLPYGATGTAPLGVSLKDSGGSLVSVGSATDAHGATVITAALNSSKGGIIGFQSAPPAGLTLTGHAPATPPVLPSVTDSAGKAVPYSVGYDQYGGAVLQIQLTDLNGKSTKLYTQVDSLGYPVSGGPAPTASSAVTDLAGVGVPVSVQKDQFGNQIQVATLTNAQGQQVQYQTQSPGAVSLAAALSTTNPVGPQTPQAGPTDSKGNTISNLTLYTAAGNTVDQITLYGANGTPTPFYGAKDSAGNATQNLTLTPVATKPPLKAFTSNPALTPTATPQLPSSLHPFTTPGSALGGPGNPYLGLLFGAPANSYQPSYALVA